MHYATVTLFLQNILSIDSSKSFCIKQKPKLEQPAFCPPSWRRELGDLIIVFQDLNSCCKEDRGSLFTRKYTENKRGKKYKLHWEKFHLNRKKNLVRTIIHWSNLLRDVAELSSLGIFNM